MSVRSLTASFALALAVPALASAQQWDPRDAAIERCSQELQYRMSRDVGGRQPDARIDQRRAQFSQSGSETRVRGNGRYMRDYNDRGRDFTFDCTFNSRNNSARANYNWSGSNWDGAYPDPDPGYGRPPSSGYPPSGRVFFSGGIVSRVSNKCLDVEGASNRNATNVQQWGCSGGANQLWDIVDLSRGEYLDHEPAQQQGADRWRWRQRRRKCRTGSVAGRRQSTLAARARRQWRLSHHQHRHQLLPRCRGRQA